MPKSQWMETGPFAEPLLRRDIAKAKAQLEQFMIDLADSIERMADDDKKLAACFINLSDYLRYQLERLDTWLNETTDLLAWVGRNIQEAKMWVYYLIEDKT